MKKILFVIESLGRGGAEKVLTTILRHLDKNKFDVTVLIVVETGEYIDEVKKYSKVQSILPDYNKLNNVIDKVKYKIEYKKIYKINPKKIYTKYIKEKYDVEIAFVEGYVTKLVMGSPNLNSKKICWVHIDMEKNPYADRYFKTIEEEKETYKRYDKIVGVSNSVKEVFEKKFELKERVTTIYNPIDKKEILEKSQEKITIKKGKKIRIVTVGRLEHQKGYDRLIKALGIIKKETSNFQVWILGEGSMRQELEELIHINNLENEVKLLGFIKNPYPFIEAGDAFVCTSRAEGYSLVIAEAMILGKPVLSVDCSGPNELLEYGKYGVLIKNTDEEILRMLNSLILGGFDLEKLQKLSEIRSKEFNLKNIMKKIEELIE